MSNKIDRWLAGLGVFAVLIWLALAIGSVVGYIINIIHIIGMDHVLRTGLGIVRVIGIFFPPLGAFMGLFDRFF